MRRIQITPITHRVEFREMFERYMRELSMYDDTIEFDRNGNCKYVYFDRYWEDKNRYPIYFYVDDVLMGFTMIRELNPFKYQIAEFYVEPEFRKDGNSLYFANTVVELFDGEFEFSTKLKNIRAVKFWDKFIGSYANTNAYDEDDERNWSIRRKELKEHTLNVVDPYFSLIASGEKIYEGRLNDEKRQLIDIGDIIVINKEPERVESVKAVVINKLYFKDFDDVAHKVDKDLLGFRDVSKDMMVDTYNSFYSKDKQDKYGVIILELKVFE